MHKNKTWMNMIKKLFNINKKEKKLKQTIYLYLNLLMKELILNNE